MKKEKARQTKREMWGNERERQEKRKQEWQRGRDLKNKERKRDEKKIERDLKIKRERDLKIKRERGMKRKMEWITECRLNTYWTWTMLTLVVFSHHHRLNIWSDVRGQPNAVEKKEKNWRKVIGLLPTVTLGVSLNHTCN